MAARRLLFLRFGRQHALRLEQANRLEESSSWRNSDSSKSSARQGAHSFDRLPLAYVTSGLIISLQTCYGLCAISFCRVGPVSFINSARSVSAKVFYGRIAIEQQNVWLTISFHFFKWPAVPGKSVVCLRGSSGPEHLWACCPSASYCLAPVRCKLSLGEQEVRYLLPNVYIFTMFGLNQQILPVFKYWEPCGSAACLLLEAAWHGCGWQWLGLKTKTQPWQLLAGEKLLLLLAMYTSSMFLFVLFIPFSGLRAPRTMLFWFSFRLEWQRLISMWGSCWMHAGQSCGCRWLSAVPALPPRWICNVGSGDLFHLQDGEEEDHET